MDGAWIPNGPTSSWISHTATSVSTKTGAYISRVAPFRLKVTDWHTQLGSHLDI
jgi:hypothetical protein